MDKPIWVQPYSLHLQLLSWQVKKNKINNINNDINNKSDETQEKINPPLLSSESVVGSLCICLISLYFSSTSWTFVVTTKYG